MNVFTARPYSDKGYYWELFLTRGIGCSPTRSSLRVDNHRCHHLYHSRCHHHHRHNAPLTYLGKARLLSINITKVEGVLRLDNDGSTAVSGDGGDGEVDEVVRVAAEGKGGKWSWRWKVDGGGNTRWGWWWW